MSLSGAEPVVAVADLFEVAPCGYVVLERNGTIRRANAEFLRLVDATPDEVVGRRTLSSLVSTGGQILLETHVRPILDHAGEVREIALELVRPDGGRVPVLLNARVLDAESQTVADRPKVVAFREWLLAEAAEFREEMAKRVQPKRRTAAR